VFPKPKFAAAIFVLHKRSYRLGRVSSTMATIESQAFFDNRMLAIGLLPNEAMAVRAHGWTTLADFAFSSSWTPGQADDEQFRTKVIAPVLGAEDHPSAAKLRRLMFEAYTLSVADLRTKVTRTAGDPPMRLSAPERALRMSRLQTKLVGINIRGMLEPSHALVDAYCQMLEDDTLKYTPWEELTMRSQEVEGVKKDLEVVTQVWSPDAAGVVRQHQQVTSRTTDLTSDLKIKSALQRRGLAMDVAGLCSFARHHELIDILMEEFMRKPLEGYAALSIQQVMRADRHAFVKMAEMTAAGLKRRADGTLPVETALSAVIATTHFQFLLMQLPGKAAGAQGSAEPPAPDKLAKKRKHEEEVAAAKVKKAAKVAAKAAVKTGARPASAPAGKGAGKGQRMPLALIGCDPCKPDGSRICFNYNLGTCKAQIAPGAACPAGWHVCCMKGCFAPHAKPDH
jgi:hypothetical protein